MSAFRRLFSTVVLAGASAAAMLTAFALLAGCGEDTGSPMDAGPDDGTPAGITDPNELVAALAAAWERHDRDALDAVLAPDFQFDVRSDELDQFPWTPSGSWGRNVELAFARNMFDPGYQGQSRPIQSINFDYTVLVVSPPVDGKVKLTIDANITVLTGPNSGLNADTRFVLTTEPQPDGFLKLLKMQELLKLEPGRGAGGGPQYQSWGQIKNLYG